MSDKDVENDKDNTGNEGVGGRTRIEKQEPTPHACMQARERAEHLKM